MDLKIMAMLVGHAKGEKLPPLKERLAKLGLVTDWDFVLHLPLRYEDETAIDTIASIHADETVQVQGRVVSSEIRNGRFEQLIAEVDDGTGRIQVRLLHFFASQRTQLAEGALVRLYGQIRTGYYGVLEMVHPKILRAIVPGVSELPKTLTPIYPAGESITQHWLKRRIERALKDVDIHDLVPEADLTRLGLPSLRDAIDALHHPAPNADLTAYTERTAPAWQRLKFDELLAQQIALRESRLAREHIRAPRIPKSEGGLSLALRSHLPFSLTSAQERVSQEIARDLDTEKPMQRLLQGDVGSGKTIVAALAAAQTIDAGFQVALMAPTEILAEQHFQKLERLLAPLGVRLLWLSGSLKPKEKGERQVLIAEGACDLVVGTHALISQGVSFARLGLAIIDEQHRFGVNQRLKLRHTGESKQTASHLLMLSATPIPRTLAMSYLADVDVSVIDELPPRRTPVTTKLIGLERVGDVEQAIVGAIANHSQCYWVCPLIEESEKADLTAACMRAENLSAAHPNWRVGLVHGAMKTEEKQAVMQRFSQGELDVLVATTVIEVGVDVPNACTMVIEHAERFGLSQLHQLRGRVGRGTGKSVCILLFAPELTETAKMRLKTIRANTDGFEIARVDLQLRGPGEFLGARQSGMPMLRFADLDKDTRLLEEARNLANQWLVESPQLAQEHARRWYAGCTEFLGA